MNRQDTICAPATALGGGMAVIRVSGSRAKEIGLRLSRRTLSHRYATPSKLWIEDRIIDFGVVTLFEAPHSYTGEDVLEISCHASTYIVQEIVSDVIRHEGCRLAEAGEFTRRALANGKLDLSQAEAVADLIASTTAAQHRIALEQHTGRLSLLLNGLRDSLIRFSGLMELELDFSEEDVTFADRAELDQLLSDIQQQIKALTQSYATAQEIQRGIPTAIVGAPNVGKSSLLNALLRHDRAIVSNIPGTTRDTIEEQLIVGGTLFRLIDTAGLRHTDDHVEQLGIDRSYQQISAARLILWVVSPTERELPNIQSLQQEARQIADHREDLTSPATLLLILNKQDLIDHDIQESWLDQAVDSVMPILSPVCAHIKALPISAHTGQGIRDLEQEMKKASDTPQSTNSESAKSEGDPIMIYNIRHLQALQSASKALAHVERGLHSSLSNDLITPSLHEAIESIGQITGSSINSDSVLHYIFSHFCIGK